MGEPFNAIIQPLSNPEETRACAAMLADSEPWITLKLTFDAALASLTDRSREVYVARVGAATAGLVMVNMQGPFAGYIQVLAVAPEWRGRGLGAQLVRFAEERIFRESPNVFLCVSGFNPRAQKFYARLGYERVGELQNYVIAGASEFLLRKTSGPKRDFKKAL